MKMAKFHREEAKYKRFLYSQEDLLTAVDEVRSKKRTLNDAARTFNIPKSTLHNKVSEKVPLSRRMGPKPVLLPAEEDMLENWILNKAKVGFPMHPEIVKDTVQTVLKKLNRENPFVDDRPGRTWLASYLKRKPTIVKRHAETISKARASVTEETLRSWFAELRAFLEEEGATDIMEDSSRIYNADETGVQTCPKTGIVLGPKGFKNLYEVACGAEKESITVLCNFSADGKALPPFVVFPYQRIPAHITTLIPDDFGIGRSDSGWMQSSTFFEYVSNIFYPWLLENNIKFPVIFFLDGHKSHLSMELCDFCIEKKIIIYCLPPNATHIMQPCDVAIFKPLKDNWRKLVRAQKQSTKSITKSNFAPLFKQAFDAAAKPETIKNGFKVCGLFPFDENAVDYSKCISRRNREIAADMDSDVGIPSPEEYAAAKKVIEHTIGCEETKYFMRLKEDNVDCDAPVYKIWNLCLKKCNTSQRPVNFSQNDILTICDAGNLQPSTYVVDNINEDVLLNKDVVVLPLEGEGSFTADSLETEQELILSAICSESETSELILISQNENNDANMLIDDIILPTDSTIQKKDPVIADKPSPVLVNIRNKDSISDINNNSEREMVAETNDQTCVTNADTPNIQSELMLQKYAANPASNLKDIEKSFSVPAESRLNTHLTKNNNEQKKYWDETLISWPKVDNKKKRRATQEREPFAITSKKWKEIQIKKENAKVKKAEEAAEKRRLREQKKKEKEANVNKKKNPAKNTSTPLQNIPMQDAAQQEPVDGSSTSTSCDKVVVTKPVLRKRTKRYTKKDKTQNEATTPEKENVPIRIGIKRKR